MKKLLSIVIILLISNCLQAQSYIPLLVDSQYYWSCQPYTYNESYDKINCEEGVGGFWFGYSYDSNDSVVQVRRENLRHSYTYLPDTIYQLNEELDTNFIWNIFSESATIYENGLKKSKMNRNYPNNNWGPADIYTYNNAGQETSILSTNYKKETKYDGKGNKIEEAEYFIYDNNTLEFSKGKLFEYDNYNRLIQEIVVRSLPKGERYRTSRKNWIYGNDEHLDSVILCNYNYKTGLCERSSFSTYTDLGGDINVMNYFFMTYEGLRHDEKQITYNGENVYNNNPDSVITYQNSDSLIFAPKIRRYYKIEELENNRIYFRQEVYTFYSEDNDWSLTYLGEEWFHKKTTTAVDDFPNLKKLFSIFPNPCKVGQNLYFNNIKTDNGGIEIIILDIQGRLVSLSNLNNQSFIIAPKLEGMYILLAKEKGKLIGFSKQVIIK